MNWLGLLFDGGLAVLLTVTIGYCSRLSRRIRLLQDGRGELGAMITQFDQATGRAMTSMAELQSLSKRITEALQLKIDRANFLADDLAFLIEKSTKLAAQVEQANQRTAELAASAPPPPAESRSFFTPAGASRQKMPAYKPGLQTSESLSSAGSLEALLNRLGAGEAIPGPAPLHNAPRKPSDLRTESERELLEALKSGR